MIVPALDQTAIRSHAALLHELAAPLAGNGKLVVASYGEDPATGTLLVPMIAHFAIGQVNEMTDMIVRLCRERHRNVYAPLAVLRPDLPDGKKGAESDVVAVLGLVADFDDEHAAEWPVRLPQPPNYVLETSAGRFQAFYLFDRPERLAHAKPIAVRLKEFARCDNGSVDMSHVWRIPGTPNWPNVRKAKAGRPLDPQLARVAVPGNGARAELAAVDATLLEEAIEDRKASSTHDDRTTGDDNPEPRPNGFDRDATAEISLALVLKLLPAWLRKRIAEPDRSGDRSKTLYAVVCGLAALGFDRHLIRRIVDAHPNGVGEKHVGRNDLDREIGRILAKAPPPGAGNGNDTEAGVGRGMPWSYSEDDWEDLYMPRLQDRTAARRRFIVDQWLPTLETTGFSGAGGQGKTLTAMQLATAAALGRHWFGIALPRIKVAALLCEDRVDDVHIRQIPINRLYECEFADLENLVVYPRRSHPRNRLMIFDRDGVGHPTTFFFQLLRKVAEFGAELVIIDTRADVFLGNQNDEDQARTFVRLICDRIAEEIGGAVLLLSHPSRAGKRDGSGESGSVQWDAAFRSRWYLDSKADEDESGDSTARILTRVKSNFAQRDETIELKWDDGVLIRTDTPAPIGFAASARQQKAERVFLALVDKVAAQGRRLSENNRSPDYAPMIFSRQGDREGLTKRDFEAAMERLLGRNEIRLDPYGPPSHGKMVIAKVGRAQS